MNTTIDFKTAKTIENMSRKIDGMERAVSGFFNKMSDIAERKYGDPQVYLAAVGPARDLSAILRWFHGLHRRGIQPGAGGAAARQDRGH